MPASPTIKKTTDRRLIWLHILGCLCFIVLPFLFFPRPQDILAPFNNPQTIRDMIGQCLLIGFFYLTYYLLIPNYYQPRKYITFVLIVIACFAVVALLPSLVIKGRFAGSPPFAQQNFPGRDRDNRQPPPDFSREQAPDGGLTGPPPMRENDDTMDFVKEINHYIFLFLVVLFFSLMLSINNQWKQTQKEKLDAELSYLKAQINPHFLFNTLNSIYSLTIQKSDTASDAVVKLAGMMRYVLYEADKELVSLSKEIGYIRDYIELQKLRFGSQVPVELVINGQANQKQIAPLILISFVENAFKHGVNAEEDSHIFIRIDIEEKELIMQVKNNKVHVQNGEHSGIGMQNAKNRLQLSYPAKHTLRIEDTATYFWVNLSIDLEAV